MIVWFDALDSTNAYGLREAERLASGTLVVAGVQTAGRGRRGTTWHSPAGAGFYGSLVVKVNPRVYPEAVWSQLAGLVALIAAREHGVAGAWLKWPNDVYAGDRKLAGVLAEAKVLSADEEAIVLGMGMNLNLDAAATAAIGRPVTSVLLETGKQVEVRALAESIHGIAERYLSQLQREGAALVFAAWLAEDRLVGRHVVVNTEVEPIEGTVAGLGADGALELRLADGSRRRFLAGDVSLTGVSACGR